MMRVVAAEYLGCSGVMRFAHILIFKQNGFVRNISEASKKELYPFAIAEEILCASNSKCFLNVSDWNNPNTRQRPLAS